MKRKVHAVLMNFKNDLFVILVVTGRINKKAQKIPSNPK